MRAPRFPLSLPVRYRRLDHPEWWQGSTENISHSGALVRGDSTLQVDTPVELRLLLPNTNAGVQPEIFCRGRVVRTVPAAGDQHQPGIAVAIDQYNFLPPIRPVAPPRGS